MEAKRYRALILKDGKKAPTMDSVVKAADQAARAGKRHWSPKLVKLSGGVYAFDEAGNRVCTIERDIDGLGITVTHPSRPELTFDVPLTDISFGVPELPEPPAKPKMLERKETNDSQETHNKFTPGVGKREK